MIEFDAKHSEALGRLAQEVLNEVRITDAPRQNPPSPPKNPIHPIFTFTEENIIGTPVVTQTLRTIDDQEAGRFWVVSGKRIGWEGESYQKIRKLASDLESKKPLKGLVSFEFLMEEIFKWLTESLEQKTSDSLAEYLKRRCEEEIRDVEIWIPIHQTYARENFKIGTVTFKPITKELMDSWYGRLTIPPAPDIIAAMNRERSKLQATLAACTCIRAEKIKASQVAIERTNDSVALLRFISEANLTCKIRSYVTPLGMEREDTLSELHIENGAIKNTISRALRSGTAAWNVDKARHLLPGLLEQLDGLASDTASTELRKSLFESLLIYSKNTLTLDPSEKLVFVLVSLESLLLRDSSEPIQGNLAERLAFLVGESLEERKAVVAITKSAYALRSRFVHHGREINDLETLNKFLMLAWQGLANLINNLDNFARREDLISYLNDRRLA